MKVLQLCPLWIPVSPNATGGIEILLAQLIAELDKLGCEITLIASGESQCPQAELIPAVPVNLREQICDGRIYEYVYYEQHQLALALPRLHEFDIIHSHIGPGAYALSALPDIGRRVLHSQHTPVFKDLSWYVERHPEMWISTVSGFQARKLAPTLPERCAVIHNGTDVSKFTFNPNGGNELFFMGRVEEFKGPDIAIEVANALGLPLAIAGPIVNSDFFESRINPFLNERIRYIGVLNHEQKNEWLGRAGCVLLPFRGEESFGLIMVEAMLCGTPVIALNQGAVPEVVENGITGYVTDSNTELPALVESAMKLDRRKVRERAAERFDITVAARKYFELYQRIAASVRAEK